MAVCLWERLGTSQRGPARLSSVGVHREEAEAGLGGGGVGGREWSPGIISPGQCPGGGAARAAGRERFLRMGKKTRC